MPEVMDAAQLDWLQKPSLDPLRIVRMRAAFSMALSPIGSKWEPSSPSTTPVTSLVLLSLFYHQ